MTAQQPDLVRVAGRSYALTAVQGDGLFDPATVGLAPVMISTACWRGFFVEYSVVDNQLLMTSLWVGPVSELSGRTVTEGQELLGGCWVASDSAVGSALRLDGLAVPLRFTGSLIVGDGLVPQTYRHMGFHPAWKFATVLELSLRDGAVTAMTDHSEQLRLLREQILTGERADPDGSPGGLDWIARTFTLDRDRSGLAPRRQD